MKYRKASMGLLVLALSIMPVLSSAQESSSSSATGSGAITEPQTLMDDRAARLKDFASAVSANDAAEAAYRDAVASYFRTRADNRGACRDDLRRANKNTLMKTLLRCYRSELSSFKDFLGQQLQEFKTTAGLTSAVRSQASNRVNMLIDAVSTITFAVDSGVYSTQDQLLEAKHNLYTKYELPVWDVWAMVRADRAVTWIAQLVADLDTLHAQEVAAGSDRSDLTDARSCLTTNETSLRALIAPDAQKRAQALTPLLLKVQSCVKTIQNISNILTGSGTLIQ